MTCRIAPRASRPLPPPAPRYTTVPFMRCPSRPTSARFRVSKAARICGNKLSTSSKKHRIISRTISWLPPHRSSANSGSKTTVLGGGRCHGRVSLGTARVRCGQLVGALLLADVDDRRAAESLLPLAVLGGDALDQRIDRLPVLQNLDLAGLLDVGRQHPRQKSANRRGPPAATNWPKRLWITASRSRPSRAAPARLTSRIRPCWSHRKYATGAKSNRSEYLCRRLLGRCLGGAGVLRSASPIRSDAPATRGPGRERPFRTRPKQAGLYPVQTLLRLAALQGQLGIEDSGGRRLSGL